MKLPRSVKGKVYHDYTRDNEIMTAIDLKSKRILVTGGAGFQAVKLNQLCKAKAEPQKVTVLRSRCDLRVLKTASSQQQETPSSPRRRHWPESGKASSIVLRQLDHGRSVDSCCLSSWGGKFVCVGTHLRLSQVHKVPFKEDDLEWLS